MLSQSSGARRLWLAVQIGHQLLALWPFDRRAAVYRQSYGVVMLGAGMSDHP